MRVSTRKSGSPISKTQIQGADKKKKEMFGSKPRREVCSPLRQRAKRSPLCVLFRCPHCARARSQQPSSAEAIRGVSGFATEVSLAETTAVVAAAEVAATVPAAVAETVAEVEETQSCPSSPQCPA